jgi:hypothetical protein
MIGIPLGLLIGIVTGLVVCLIIKTAWTAPRLSIKSVATLVGQLLEIPTFWLGGPWISGSFLGEEKLTELLPYYISSLACTFGAISIYPLFNIVVSLGRTIGRAEVRHHGR